MRWKGAGYHIYFSQLAFDICNYILQTLRKWFKICINHSESTLIIFDIIYDKLLIKEF